MATPIDDQGITPETISFRQVARIAGWSDQPLFMIGFEHSVCSRRFPIAIAPSQRHAQLLGDSLNDRYANKPMMPRFGWLPENDFPAHKSVNIKTSIGQAQTGKLHGEAAADIHSIAKEAEAVNETIADSVGPDIVSCDGPQPGRFYVFVRLFPGLLVSSPWKEWVVLPDGDVDAAMLSDARKWARENWDQVVAKVQKQSRLRMGTPPCREDEESEDVERQLAEMLDRANRQTIKAKLAADTQESTNLSQAFPDGGNAAQGDEPTTGGPWSKPDSPTRWAEKYRCSQGMWVDTRIAIHPAEPKPGQIRVKQHSTESYSVHVDDLPNEAHEQLLKWAQVTLGNSKEGKLVELIVAQGVTDKSKLREALGYGDSETLVFNTLLGTLNKKLKQGKKSRKIGAFYWLDGGDRKCVKLLTGDDAKLRHY